MSDEEPAAAAGDENRQRDSERDGEPASENESDTDVGSTPVTDPEQGVERGPAEEGGADWTPAWLADLRETDDRRHAALVAAALVGLAAAMVHWLGLFLAGALVGLVCRTVPRAVAAGVGVGVLVLVVHVGASPVMGPGEFLALSPASYLTVAVGLLAPVWGSLVRGVL
jgi:hypothetical protein